MHVDGSRFNRAQLRERDESGHVMLSPPVLLDIESDPTLAGAKLIAEAWDAAGLYQVGSFIGDSWREWNGRVRDDVRSFFRGEEGLVERFADRLIGSPALCGNNNAYCQDNETSWFDWTLLAKRADVHRFVTLLNARRVLRDVEPERQRVALNQLIRQADITWHGVRLHEPDWRHYSHSVAFTARFAKERVFFHVILNAYWEPLEFELSPVANGGRHPWRRWIDTFLDSPHDIVDWGPAPSVPCPTYRAEPRSRVVLFLGPEPERQSPGDR